MNQAQLIKDLAFIIPELILSAGVMILVLIGAFLGKKSYRAISYLSVVLLLAAGFAGLHYAPESAVLVFQNGLKIDDFGGFAKLIIAITTSAAILLSIDFLSARNIEKPEYPVLALLATIGMYIMVSSNSLLALYMGVELQSLALYVLAAYARDSQKSSEAGLKYFVLGALSSGILLYGISLVYGFSGSIEFAHINKAVSSGNIGLLFGLVFVLSGVAFKMSVAPFHMWTPDVYEGSPTPSTAFFATAPKFAATILFARVCFDAFGGAIDDWRGIIQIMAVLSMFVGSIFALQQNNLKRLLAYSSIANMGYAMVAISSGPEFGPSALLVFSSVYAITSIGMFGALLSLRKTNGRYIETVTDLAGVSKQKPALAIAFSVMLFSVMGIPPLAGFFGKFEIFLAAVRGGVIPMAIVLVIASVISAFYYLRILKTMWFDEADATLGEGFATTGMTLVGTTIMLATLTPLIGLLFGAALVASQSLN